MAKIKLANGQEIKELRVWDGVKWVAKRGRIFNGVKWIDFIRPPLSFKDDFITTTGMTRQTAKTLVREPVSVGQRTLLVQNATGFNVGDEITITDGVSSECIKVLRNNLFSLKFYSDVGNYDGVDVYRYHETKLPSNKRYVISSWLKEGAIPISNFWLSFVIGHPNPNKVRDVGGTYIHIINNGNVTSNGIILPKENLPVYISYYPPTTNPALIKDNYLIQVEQLDRGEIVEWIPAPEDIYGTADNVLSITPTKNSYKGNSLVARTNAVIENSKLVHSVHKTYSVK